MKKEGHKISLGRSVVRAGSITNLIYPTYSLVLTMIDTEIMSGNILNICWYKRLICTKWESLINEYLLYCFWWHMFLNKWALRTLIRYIPSTYLISLLSLLELCDIHTSSKKNPSFLKVWLTFVVRYNFIAWPGIQFITISSTLVWIGA